MSLENKVLMQEWLESERGWGIRPDGFSFHLSLSDLRNYVREYWKGMPDEVPHEYSRPCGEPRQVTVQNELYKAVEKSKNGVRTYDRCPPPGTKY